jgi:HEAT repeat protein
LSLIKQFGDTLVAEALRRLNDSRWFVKRNMLYLLRGCKDKGIIPHVRIYCEHENPKVGFEAIKCLLSLKDDYGVEKLTGYLGSGTRAEIEQAITLAGVYAVEEAVPELVQMLRGKGKNKFALRQKIAIIQALGNIGDMRSLDALREILFRKKFFLFKGGNEELQVEIYKALKNYPYEYIEDILRKGIKSGIEYIKNESLRLIRMREQ